MATNELNLFLKQQNYLENIIAKEQDQIIKMYATSYRNILFTIKAIYNKYAKNGKLENADKAMLNRLNSIEKECVDILKKTHAQVEEFITERAKFAYGESFFRHAYYINEGLALNVDWGVVPKNAVEVAALDNYELLAKSETFLNASKPSVNTLREVFTSGLIEGKSYEKIRDALIKKIGAETVSANAVRYVGTGIAAWAMMVARTETHRAMSLGQKKTEQICKDNGLDIDWYWCATLDGRTRAEHGALDGQKKDETQDGWYVPSIGYVKGPGLSGVARFDINCRCCVRPQYRYSSGPTQRYIRDEGGVTKYKSYKEWRENISTAPRGEFKFNYSGDDKAGAKLKSLVMKTLTSNNTALKSVSDLNYNFLKNGKAKYTVDGKMDGKLRAYSNKTTINIPSYYMNNYGSETIAHETRHFIEFNAKQTETIKEARSYFESMVEKTMRIIQPNDSRWDKLETLAKEHISEINISDLIDIVSKSKIATGFSHYQNEIVNFTSKCNEISADLHAIATTNKALYIELQNVLDELTDGFEQYTIKLLEGK